MKNIELLVLLLEKEVGPLKKEGSPVNNGSGYYTLEFVHNDITLKIILIEMKRNHWIIHHELSKESPLLLKKIARVCDRIRRIKEGKTVSFQLSADLEEILEQNFINTVIKTTIQNLLINYFPLYKNEAPIIDRKIEKEMKYNKQYSKGGMAKEPEFF